VDGHHPIKEVCEREELYEGSAVNCSPELILELNLRDGYSYTLLSSGMVEKGVLWKKLERDEHFGGKGLGMNGTHRQHGILCLSGSGVEPKEVSAGMEDIAPTILHLMGEPVPKYMDGTICTGNDQTISYCEEDPRIQSEEEFTLTSKESQALQERLQRLGYL
jgi:predicted AlkP superfamily phosphohydrolase/phosphomutase